MIPSSPNNVQVLAQTVPSVLIPNDGGQLYPQNLYELL